MRFSSVFTLAALAAAATAIPLEAEGGIVVQAGTGNTKLGMLYKSFGSDLEGGDTEEHESEELEPMESTQEVNPNLIIAERLPEPTHEETIVIVDGKPEGPDLILPGLLNLFAPLRRPLSPLEGTLGALDEVIDQLKHGQIGDSAGINVKIGVGFPEIPGPPEIPDLLSMIEPAMPRLMAGDAMMIEIIP
ncbi:hypothetical protein H072_2675 [Dactylellina haptotyla CBS 200.50]|uniref:Uncharacterized protein n=1 Tax=Dactylellina haptotyla (strain CBS 200.50) TaxID=1284197 RepID=S8AK92_DACHA|nr:hypothetical protein H072_2675 [Dactylellina haptotyla CBS 200.50]